MTRSLSSRDFGQDIVRAKRRADDGPVVITDRGKPTCVLMKHEAYEKLARAGPSILDLLADPASDDVEFDPAPLEGGRIKGADLT